MKLYEALGVPVTASADEIKAAYRRLVKETHPDTGGDREKFHQVQHAYEVLSDPQRRARYDEGGEQGDGAKGPSPIDMLVQAFDAVLDAPMEMSSPLAMLKIVLEERLKNERRDLAEHERQIARWRKMMERFERKNGDAILESVIERRMRPHVQGAESARHWIEGLQIAIGMTAAYRYRCDDANGDNSMADLLAGMMAEHLEEKPRRRRAGRAY